MNLETKRMQMDSNCIHTAQLNQEIPCAPSIESNEEEHTKYMNDHDTLMAGCTSGSYRPNAAANLDAHEAYLGKHLQ